MKLLFFLCLLLCTLSLSAQQKDAPRVVIPKETTVLPLLTEELSTLQTLGAGIEKVLKLETAAYERLEVATEDADILAAGRALQVAILKRKTLQRDYQEWLAKARAAHQCPSCELAPDGKALLKKEEKKNAQ